MTDAKIDVAELRGLLESKVRMVDPGVWDDVVLDAKTGTELLSLLDQLERLTARERDLEQDYAKACGETFAAETAAESSQSRVAELTAEVERERADKLTAERYAVILIEEKNVAQALVARLRGALEGYRSLIPETMKFIMYDGRDGLLLADRLHKADDAARQALQEGA